MEKKRKKKKGRIVGFHLSQLKYNLTKMTKKCKRKGEIVGLH